MKYNLVKFDISYTSATLDPHVVIILDPHVQVTLDLHVLGMHGS